MESTRTDTGDFEHYCFGPFTSPTPIEGSNGIARCAGGKVWKDAAALIVRVWPLIVDDLDWQECLTVKGRWPLHNVPGWPPRERGKKNALELGKRLVPPRGAVI